MDSEVIRGRRNPRTGILLIFIVLAFVFGLGSGYLLWGGGVVRSEPAAVEAELVTPTASAETETTAGQTQTVSLPASYTLPATFGTIGPQLVATGAIDYDRFVQLYEQRGRPLTEAQLAILTTGGDTPITIDQENAHFLLNFFWALGLTNQNAVLTEGPMMQNGLEQVGRFASTGGWTLGIRPATDLYASTALVSLTPQQQERLEEVAAAVYRPCCNNPTLFPDCNHGMAMLGLLELMASQGASVNEMFTAAKYVNTFWFPQQSLELAAFFQAAQGQDFAQIEPRQFVSMNVSSSSGFQAVHQWLTDNGGLKPAPNGGSNCGV
ncbi:MAG: hypothetical protein AB1791_01300 [Chloroflexota bacterium]